MKSIAVLGAGRVGSAMALDMATNHKVRLFDRKKESLEHTKEKNQAIEIHEADLEDLNAFEGLFKDDDLVISAVPGFMGYKVLEALIEAGKNVVDISFFPEDALELDELAKQKKVTAIVDCGVAPGMDNILLGYWDQQIEVREFECLVGGLPEEKKWPFNYKAPFSPIDVIEEYIRPARIVEDGQVVIKAPLSEVEVINFPGVGDLEAFNSDGLRSLVTTMPHIPKMKEKTMRFPGHAQNIMVLKESGFFDTNEIEHDGQKIIPLEFTSELLIKDWFLRPGEKDFTAMRLRILGIDNGKEREITYFLLDRFDEETGISSMGKTTGYTATAAANLFLEGKYDRMGISPPEYLGESGKENLDFILKYLKNRGVVYRKEEA